MKLTGRLASTLSCQNLKVSRPVLHISSLTFPVIGTADSYDSVMERLPTLLKDKKVAAVALGGAFSNELFHQILSEIPDAQSVPWLRPEATNPNRDPSKPMPSGPPTPEGIAKRLRDALCEYQRELERWDGAGEVWYF